MLELPRYQEDCHFNNVVSSNLSTSEPAVEVGRTTPESSRSTILGAPLETALELHSDLGATYQRLNANTVRIVQYKHSFSRQFYWPSLH